jgi:selenocysteine lyase/cysteine desulfurase
MCLEYCEKGPSDPETQKFIRNGERGTSWGGIDDLFVRLANFLSVPPEHLTFHERTTSAITFALQEIITARRRQNLPPARLLTTDIEYPGILNDLLPEFVRQGDIELLRLIEIKQLICTGTNREHIQSELKTGCHEQKPDVLLVTHVYYATGYVIEMEALLRAVDGANRPIIIIDGAQSIGNIELSSRIFQQVEYYATGAHKWLLVPRHLGILIRNRDLLLNRHKYGSLETPKRPDSSYPFVSRPFSVTISYDPYFGLSSMLRNELQIVRMNNIANHNRRLADLFRNEILALGYRALGDENQGSMVSVSFAGMTEPLHRSLQLHGIKCKFLRIEHSSDTLPTIRFCFHFYHGKDDVFRLLDFIETEVVRGRS